MPEDTERRTYRRSLMTVDMPEVAEPRALGKRPRLEQSGSSFSIFSFEDFSALDENFEFVVDPIDSVCTVQQQWHPQLLEKCLSRDFLSILPPEITFIILGYLDVEDLLSGLQVCRKWRLLITEATPVWRAVAMKCDPSHLLAEELRFRLPVPVYDLLKGGTETDIQDNPRSNNSQTQPNPFHPQARITWNECAELPVGTYAAQTVVIRGKVYVGGGVCDTNAQRHQVFSYSPSENVWSSLPDCPVRWFGMGQLDGRVVAIGGKRRSDDEITDEVYVLDEDSQSWKNSIIPPLNAPRRRPAVLSHHSSLIVAGGYTQSGRTSVVELFRKDMSQWHRTCPLPFPCRDMSSVVIQNTACLLGGSVGSEIYSNQMVYASVDSLLQKSLPPDQTSEDRDSVWKTLPNTPRYVSAAATINGCLLAVGGGDTSEWGSTPQKEVYIYSPSTASWLHVSDLPFALRVPTTAMISPTEFLVISGRDNSFSLSHSVFKASLKFYTDKELD